MAEIINRGMLVISLDLELYWGVRDVLSIERYRDNLDGVRCAVDNLLIKFRQYGIHATWATVGFLFHNNIDELKENIPLCLPKYDRSTNCPYKYIFENYQIEQKYHFCPDIINKIKLHPAQEIATHTYSHYYCLEKGQSEAAFIADLQMAVKIAEIYNISMSSIVFPRNQVNPRYIDKLNGFGIKTYRGVEENAYINSVELANMPNSRRAMRLLDTYTNITGFNTYKPGGITHCGINNVRSSRFLRPYKNNGFLFNKLKLLRIKNSITYAAKNKEIYHLWWHPHNFGKNIEENIDMLSSILCHYKAMNHKYGMVSANMGEVSRLLLQE